MDAAWFGYTEIMKLLLDVGADVNVRDNDDRSALMIAKERGHIPIVNLLKEAGAKE